MNDTNLCFIWDVTHACPLECLYCYSDSGPGRRTGTDPAQRMAIARAIVRERARSVCFSGGEPALVPGIFDVARHLRDHGVINHLYTCGFKLGAARVDDVVDAFHIVHVSLDAADPAVNDRLRGREGAHREATRTLALLEERVRARRERGEQLPRFGIDCTLVRSNLDGLGDLVDQVVGAFPSLDFVAVNVAIPSGRAAHHLDELVDVNQVAELAEVRIPALQARVAGSVRVHLSDNEDLREADGAASGVTVQLEPTGDVRAIKICKRVAGNLVDEPLSQILARIEAWKAASSSARRLRLASDRDEWAAAVRAIDGGAA